MPIPFKNSVQTGERIKAGVESGEIKDYKALLEQREKTNDSGYQTKSD